MKEFRRFLEDLGGPRVVREIGPAESLSSFLEASISALERRNLLDKNFFDLLVEHRPRATAEIRDFQLQADPRALEFDYDVFISYARENKKYATELAQRLSHAGARVFSDADIAFGHRWDEQIRRAISSSRIVVFLLSERRTDRGVYEELRTAIEASRRSRPVRIVPVFLSKAVPELHSAFAPYHGIFVTPIGGMQDVADHLIPLIPEARDDSGTTAWSFRDRVRDVVGIPTASVDASTDLQLRDLAEQFFNSAGRTSQSSRPNELAVPEPALIAGDVPPSPTDVRSLARLLAPGDVGYFIYKDGLPENTLLALDTLRVRGNPIVPLAANTMTAALADGTARTVLAQLDSDYRSRDNLFETRNALIDERFFFGRHDLLAQIGSALGRGEHILVFGLRKAGKTSLLNILRQHLADHPFFVADLQKYDRHEENWPPLLFNHLLQAYDQWGSAKFDDWPKNGGRPRTASELEDALIMRRRWQIDRGHDERFVVVLDEIERVFPTADETKPARKFIRAAGALRSLGQSGSDRFISIIAADLRPEANRVNRLGYAGTNPFFNFFQEVPLPLLTRDAVDEMITSIGRAMGITAVDPEFMKRVFTLAGGHPFLSRLLAGAAYRLRSGDRARLSRADLERGLGHLAERDTIGSFFRENLWGELRDRERTLLTDYVAGNSPASDAHAERAFLGALGLLDDDTIPIELFAEWIANRMAA